MSVLRRYHVGIASVPARSGQQSGASRDPDDQGDRQDGQRQCDQRRDGSKQVGVCLVKDANSVRPDARFGRRARLARRRAYQR